MVNDPINPALATGDVSLQVIKVVYRRCTPEWSIPKCVIEFSNLTYVTSGEALYIIDGVSYHVKQGDMIYVPSGFSRQASLLPGQPMHCYSVDYYMRDYMHQPVQLPLAVVTHAVKPSEITELFSKLNVEWLHQTALGHLKIKALLMLLIHQLCYEMLIPVNNAAMDGRVRDIMKYISKHYAEPLSLGFFAERMNLTPIYLGALFKQHTGISFNQYLRNARLNVAEDLLTTGLYSVNEVAYMTGFEDPSYFGRVFKQVYGVSPGHRKHAERPEDSALTAPQAHEV